MKLNHQRLLSLWDAQTYSNQKKTHYKPIDGLFIFRSLFSVGAFATKKENTLVTQFAKRTADTLLQKVKHQRDTIRTLNNKLLNDCGDIELNASQPIKVVDIVIEQEKLTPESTMLVKVFTISDVYFTNLHKAVKNGELTQQESQSRRSELISIMHTFLTEMHKDCSAFHRVRKKHCEASL